MARTAHLVVSEDLDTLRRSLDPSDGLGPGLARFLAACTGTLWALPTRTHAPTDPFTDVTPATTPGATHPADPHADAAGGEPGRTGPTP